MEWHWLRLPIAYVDIRFLAHATEDVGKVKEAVHNLFQADHVEKVAFNEVVLKGHYGNSIILFEARIKNKEITSRFVEKLVAELSELDKEKILRKTNAFIDGSNLYLRLDKQAALLEEVRLQQADPIYIRIRFRNKDTDSIEIAKDIGLLP
jgi:RNA binding exosome subunit